MGQKGHIMVQKGLKIHKKRQKNRVFGPKNLLFSGIFLSGVFFTLLPNTLRGVKVNFYTFTLFHHVYFPFLFLLLHLFL